MDFVHDQLTSGTAFRILTVVDNWSRESPVLETDFRLTGERVAQTPTRASQQCSLPNSITVDHGTQFTSRALDQWAWENGVQLDFTRPGKPTDNGLCESFNGRLRDECLNVNEFESIKQAREKIEAWRIDYNEQRPHRALGRHTPQQAWDATIKATPDSKPLNVHYRIRRDIIDQGAIGQDGQRALLQDQIGELEELRVQHGLAPGEVVLLDAQVARLLKERLDPGAAHHRGAVLVRPTGDEAVQAGEVAQGAGDLKPQGVERGKGDLDGVLLGENGRDDVGVKERQGRERGTGSS